MQFDPDHEYDCGIDFLALGQYAEAEKAFKQVLRVQPDDAEAYSQLGEAYRRLDRPSEAIEAYKQAIRVQPDNYLAHYNLGTTYLEMGRHSEAVEALKHAIRVQPDDAVAYVNLGEAYRRLGRYSEAIEAFKQAICLRPDLAEAHSNLGLAYGNLGQYKEAVEVYKEAVRLKPDDATAYYNLGANYVSLGDHGGALEEYMILKDLDNNLARKLQDLLDKAVGSRNDSKNKKAKHESMQEGYISLNDSTKEMVGDLLDRFLKASSSEETFSELPALVVDLLPHTNRMNPDFVFVILENTAVAFASIYKSKGTKARNVFAAAHVGLGDVAFLKSYLYHEAARQLLKSQAGSFEKEEEARDLLRDNDNLWLARGSVLSSLDKERRARARSCLQSIKGIERDALSKQIEHLLSEYQKADEKEKGFLRRLFGK